MYLASDSACFLTEHERIAKEISVLYDAVPLVVVTQDEQLIAEFDA
jgi:hypothetical protein